MLFDPSAPQSVEYYEGEGPVHRSIKSPNELLSHFPKGAKTVYQGIIGSFINGGDSPCLGKREKLSEGGWSCFHWTTYKETKSLFETLATGLRLIGMEARTRIGIYAKNRPEWAISLAAALAQGLIIVPLYDTLGLDAVTYIINHAELHTVISSAENLSKLLTSAPECSTLKRIILMDPLTPKDVDDAKKSGITLIRMQDLMKQGLDKPHVPATGTEDDLFTILYTSGTTGVPKGVMLSHGNILVSIAAVQLNLDLRPTDVYLSYLPLAHIFELNSLINCFTYGCQVGFWRGEAQGLIEDMQALRPTIMVGAPRVFNRIYDSVYSQLAQNIMARTLFNYAYNSKLTQLHNTGEELSPLWDKLVFSKIAAILGGRIRLMISGSAPLAAAVQDFMRICFSCKVIQGYGLTETCGSLTITDPNDFRSGHVGPPSICCEVKLVDVPEMNYTSSGKLQQGEICVRGSSLMKGYYKMPGQTGGNIDRKGWFHTGDIGEWLPGGVLKIIDRKKNIFKLAQGEYVAAEYLETVYTRSNFILQAFVYGDSLKNYLVGIIVPNPEVLLPWANQQGIKGDLESLCRDNKVKYMIYSTIVKAADKAKLKGFEKVRNIYLEPQPWTVENGFLTPSLKTKRLDLRKRYSEVIDNLYSEPRMDSHSKL